MSGVIATVEQATPTWLTDVFVRTGHLATGKVLSATVARVHDEQLHSVGYFLTVSYSPEAPATAPARLFLKLPRPQAPASWVASAGEREVRLYRSVAGAGGHLPVIPCYAAAYDPDRPSYHLLLADLSATHDQPAWHLEIAERYIARTVDSLAAFHAHWWARADLPTMDGDTMSPAQRRAEVERLGDTFPAFAEALGDRLNAQGRRVYERLLAALPALWARAIDPRARTLLHGDAHFWNVSLPARPARAGHLLARLADVSPRPRRAGPRLRHRVALPAPHAGRRAHARGALP